MLVIQFRFKLKKGDNTHYSKCDEARVLNDGISVQWDITALDAISLTTF